jgi:hypothetical protein
MACTAGGEVIALARGWYDDTGRARVGTVPMGATTGSGGDVGRRCC